MQVVSVSDQLQVRAVIGTSCEFPDEAPVLA